MAVVGVGIDVVDVARFGESLDRTPGLRERLFTPGEATHRLASLAARFAAKEAVAKALGAPVGMAWHDAEVV
jgi:holo-[acyl-carrier protein] synthase